MRYRPFDSSLAEATPVDLVRLGQVSEGWYVEYKGQQLPPRSLAKSLAAFANHYGGWLFLGIREHSDGSHVAGDFCGIATPDVPTALEALRNAAKDCLNPHVFYSTRVFSGPIPEVGLPEHRSVVAVEIPAGPDAPYVHNDGKVYRRIADSSDPKPENDRAVLDRLYERGRQSRKAVKKLVMRKPITSKGEKDSCYAHISLLSDPFRHHGHLFTGGFEDFFSIMHDNNPMPFDNIFPNARGFVGRQAVSNNAFNRLLTWEFSYHCDSFVSYPLNYSTGEFLAPFYESYLCGPSFTQHVTRSQLDVCRVLDLNLLLDTLAAVIYQHRKVCASVGVKGPFYGKVYLENIWRVVPFLDLPQYIEYVNRCGIPVVQDVDVLTPEGTSLSSFAQLDERDPSSLDHADAYRDCIALALPILHALGVPIQVLMNVGTEIVNLGSRARAAQRHRSTSSR